MIKETIFVFNGVIVNDCGKILIENRSEKALPHADQRWGLPGGKIEFGETPEEVVIRETREETGCEVTVLGMIPVTFTNVWKYVEKEQHTVIFGYFGRLVQICEKDISDSKINRIKWISPNEISKYDFLPGVLELIQFVISNNLF